MGLTDIGDRDGGVSDDEFGLLLEIMRAAEPKQQTVCCVEWMWRTKLSPLPCHLLFYLNVMSAQDKTRMVS